MATPQLVALINALKNVRVIKLKIEATDGGLTKAVFSTDGPISDVGLDNARGAVALEFQSLVQNVRAVKTTDPIVRAHPDVHCNLRRQVARRSWLMGEYGATARIEWGEIAEGVCDDVPRIESGIVEALEANGVPSF
ncbi:hypothetical protein EW146_g7110 [Bondarzewia mesenterica]|uniref:Uncharacterized protein n=1 Tax=Bondarzewia mesenterica TaxID=1095465 RepID=A0A4S4LLR7_9AGAM|nr:hypothetical protein EW146_g7110 [Bondarzewia mesenterica]